MSSFTVRHLTTGLLLAGVFVSACSGGAFVGAGDEGAEQSGGSSSEFGGSGGALVEAGGSGSQGDGGSKRVDTGHPIDSGFHEPDSGEAGAAGAWNAGGTGGSAGEGGAAGASASGGIGGTGGALAGGAGGVGGAFAAGGSAGCEETDWFPDGDGDGFGRSSGAVQACEPPAEIGWASKGGDCNDDNALVFPGQTKFFAEPYATADGKLSFDYDCDRGEAGDPAQLGAHAGCGSTSLDCSGEGYSSTARVGALNPICGSEVITACVVDGLLGCAAQNRQANTKRCR